MNLPTNAPAHLHGPLAPATTHRLKRRRLVLAYKNFAANRHISHIGLGVAALNTSKVLRHRGVEVDVWPIVSAAELRQRLAAAAGQAITHIVISAPWIPTLELQALTLDYPNIQWAMNCHSNVGFLQADVRGVQYFREALALERAAHNSHAAGNSPLFPAWVEETFTVPCPWLPNLYYLDRHTPTQRTPWHRGVLRIGSFSARRPLKTLLRAAAAALDIGVALRTDLEFWVNSGRAEGGGGTVEQAILALYAGLPQAKVVQQPWQPWPDFRRTVSHMALLIQPSYTESFSMVTADAIAEGVPVVGTDVLYWLPPHWQAPADQAHEVARVGLSLLQNPHAPREGLEALQGHDAAGTRAWVSYLTGDAYAV